MLFKGYAGPSVIIFHWNLLYGSMWQDDYFWVIFYYFCIKRHILRQLGQWQKLAQAWYWTTISKYSLPRSMKHTVGIHEITQEVWRDKKRFHPWPFKTVCFSTCLRKKCIFDVFKANVIPISQSVISTVSDLCYKVSWIRFNQVLLIRNYIFTEFINLNICFLSKLSIN